MKENHFRKGEPATKDEPNTTRSGAVSPEPDLPHQGLNTLAFLLPPLGLGLYLYHRRKSPRRAASVARWSWAGVGLYLAGVLLPVLALHVWQ